MSGNPIADFLRSQEDRENLLRIEQLRRKGENFIKVRYVGNINPKIDNDGLCYNIRLHGLKDLEAYEETDLNTGRTDWKGRKGARMVSFRQSSTGDIEADIWDDPDHWNRRFIASHANEMYVVDSNLRDEISKELEKPFNAEPSRKEMLEKEIADKVKELDELSAKERLLTRSEKGKQNGIDKSTPNLDSTGVPRVAAGRPRKRDTSDLQSSTSDT